MYIAKTVYKLLNIRFNYHSILEITSIEKKEKITEIPVNGLTP